MIKVITFVFALIFPSLTLACEAPPVEQTVSPSELIARTKQIALAKVARAETKENSYEVVYTFKTIKKLKGKPKDSFQIIGHPLLRNLTDFNHHQDPIFWQGNGRSLNDTDCEIHPTFSVGAIFLVFLDKPYHVKSFEQIIKTHGTPGTKDKWLSYVEGQMLNAKKVN